MSHDRAELSRPEASWIDWPPRWKDKGLQFFARAYEIKLGVGRRFARKVDCRSGTGREGAMDGLPRGFRENASGSGRVFGDAQIALVNANNA